MDNTHRIVQVKGHYEVHDSNANFVLSGDTWDEWKISERRCQLERV